MNNTSSQRAIPLFSTAQNGNQQPFGNTLYTESPILQRSTESARELLPKQPYRENWEKETSIKAIEQQIATTRNPTDKLELLLQLWSERGWVGAEQDFESVEQALALAELVQSKYWMAKVLHRIVSCDMHYRGYTERIAFLHQARQMLKELGEEDAYYHATHTLALYYQQKGEQEKVLQLCKQTAVYYERIGNVDAAAFSLSTISTVHRNTGDLHESLAVAWRIAELGNSSCRPSIVRIAQSRLSSAYSDMGEHHKALQCNHRIEQIYEEIGHKDPVDRAFVKRNMGVNYFKLDLMQQALECFEQAIELFRSAGHCDGEAAALENIGVIHAKQGKYDEALPYFVQVEAILKLTTWSPRRRAYLYGNIAGAYNDRGDIASEIAYLDKALCAAREGGTAKIECHILLQTSYAYEQMGDTVQAFAYHKQYTALQQEMQASEKQRTLAEMQTRFEVERLEHEREVQELRADRLQQEMEHKNKELTLLALQLVQKNECFAKLKEHIHTIKKSESSIHTSMLRLIQDSLQPDQDWENFSKQFQLIHHNFHPALLERCSVLTPTELKICSLIKIGLSSKDIANILFTSVRTVETHRSTVRKKLGITLQDSLSSYLATL